MSDIPKELLTALTKPGSKELQALGTKIGQLYTEQGFPLDMALERLEMAKEDKLAVLAGAQNWFIQHRRDSGATEQALDRQRKTNQEAMRLFIKTGETGVY